MKYVVVVPDGMADYPIDRFEGRTPLQIAKTPHMDRLAREGEVGLARTIPRGLPAGSDVANLSVVGYDPRQYYTGRAPIEAASMGVELKPGDIAFRCNLVTVSGDRMADFSAGHISNKESHEIIALLNRELGGEDIRFYPGVSYRHLMVYSGQEKMAPKTTPPHDITGQPVAKHLAEGPGSQRVRELMERSRELLHDHEINSVRLDLGQNPASQIWLWGQGSAPKMEPFAEKYGPSGVVITAVDLIRGIAKCIGWDIIEVPGATGYLDTDYGAKGAHAVAALDAYDLVFVHIEATDEASHEGAADQKVLAIQSVDREIIGPLSVAAATLNQERQGCRILVMPDHYTPLAKQTHSAEPVPFVMWGPDVSPNGCTEFSEDAAKASGLELRQGFTLMGRLLGISSAST